MTDCQETGLKLSAEKSKYIFMSTDEKAQQNYNTKISDVPFEGVKQL